MSQTKTTRWFRCYLILLYFTCTMGASNFTLDLGFFQLSLFRVLFGGLVALFLLLMLLPERFGFMFQFNRSYGYYLAFGLFWVFYALVTVLWANDYKRWFIATFYIFLSLFILLMFSVGHFSLDLFTSLLVSFVLSCFVQSIFGWYEIITGNYLFLDNANTLVKYALIHAPCVFFGNINDFGTLMVAGVFGSMMCRAYYSSKHSLSVFFLFAALNMSVMVFFSTSRANLLALICGLTFCLLIRKHKWIGLWCSVSGGFVLAVLIIMNGMAQTHGSDSIRINLVLDGLSFLGKSKFLGIGAGQGEWWLFHKSTHNIEGIYNFHNWWMEILACYGVAVFSLYLAVYIKLFFTFFKSKITGKVFDLSGLACGYLVAFAFSCMSSSSLVTCEWMWCLFPLIIALGICMRSEKNTLAP